MNKTLRLVKNVVIFIALIWAIFVINLITPFYDFNQLGIVPRSTNGLIGIVLSPFLHANIAHIVSNTVPLFVLTLLLFLFYRSRAKKVMIILTLMSGMLVWLFARSACHIGASGLIYALAAFIITAGLYSRKISTILLSVFILIVYGGLVFGIFPRNFYISWESHLLGAISGIVLAYLIFKMKKKI